MTSTNAMTRTEWRKSSYSGSGGTGGGNCVEVACLPNDVVALRDSKRPGAGVVLVTRSAMNNWLNACKSDVFIDLT